MSLSSLKLQFFMIGIFLFVFPVFSESSEKEHVNLENNHVSSSDGSQELAKDFFGLNEINKRYRLHGKQNQDEDPTELSDSDDVLDDVSKRYRLYGKRLNTEISDIEKRYRLAGKRYRLVGKRYRLYGKRDQSEENQADEEKNVEKRYRLAGNGKRYRYNGIGK